MDPRFDIIHKIVAMQNKINVAQAEIIQNMAGRIEKLERRIAELPAQETESRFRD